MRVKLRRWLGIAGLAVLALAAVVVYRALTVPGGQPEPATLSGIALDGNRAVARLSEAIGIPTVSRTDRSRNDPGPFAAFRDWLADRYPRVHGTLRREVVGDGALLYTWPGEDAAAAPLLFLAHYDVVPAENAGAWRHPPFSGTVEDGWIWGRGALDDKASVVALMEAAEALLARGFTPPRTVLIAFGHDEEIGGGHGAARIAALLEERGVRPAWVLDEGSAIIEGVLPLDSPVAGIGIAEKGFLSLELVAEAEGGHSAMPPALTAAGRIARAVDRVQSNPFPARLAAPGRATLEHLAPASPFGQRLVLANLWLFEPLVVGRFERSPSTNAAIRTTIAPTMLSGSSKDNVLPERAFAVINFRILQGDSVDSVRERVMKLVNDTKVSVTRYGDVGRDPSPVADTDSAGFRAIAAAARALDATAVVVPMQVVGATDSRHFAPLTEDVYRFLPVRLTPELIDSIHGVDERIAVTDYLGMIRFYATLMEQTD